jgi:drug/metabolite transporter (DMT)-like permease
VLALSAALCWGISAFLGGLQSRRLPAVTVALWSQIVGATALALVLFPSIQSPAIASIAWGAGGGIIGAFAQLLFYGGLAICLMSIIAPVSACGAIVPVIVALATGEAPSTLALVGIAAAMLGIILVSLRGGPTPEGAGDGSRALVFALAGVAFVAG